MEGNSSNPWHEEVTARNASEILNYFASCPPLVMLNPHLLLKPCPTPEDAIDPPEQFKERKQSISRVGDGVATLGSKKRIAITYTMLPQFLKDMVPSEKEVGASVCNVQNILCKKSKASRGEEVYYAVQFKKTLQDNSKNIVSKTYRGLTPLGLKFAKAEAKKGKSHAEIFASLREHSKKGNVVRSGEEEVVLDAFEGSGDQKKITFKMPSTYTDPFVAVVARQLAFKKIEELGKTPTRSQINTALSNIHNEIIAAVRMEEEKRRRN